MSSQCSRWAGFRVPAGMGMGTELGIYPSGVTPSFTHIVPGIKLRVQFCSPLHCSNPRKAPLTCSGCAGALRGNPDPVGRTALAPARGSALPCHLEDDYYPACSMHSHRNPVYSPGC